MKRKIINIISVIGIVLIINLIYIIRYFNDISVKNIIIYLVGLTNIIMYLLYDFYIELRNVILNEEIFKCIIIIIGIYILIGKLDLVELLKSIRNIDINGVNISMEGLIKEKQEEDNKVQTMGNANEDEVNLSKRKSEIIELMIDNTYMVQLINRYINKSAKSITVPRNIIPNTITLEAISRIFEYQIKSNSIKINRIKVEIEPILIDVFNELVQKGIIYPKVM